MYQKILVPLDGSELAESSLKHVEAIALGCSARCVVVFGVVEPYGMAGTPTIKAVLGNQFVRKAEQNVKTWLSDYLEKVAAEFKEKGIDAVTFMTEGNAAEEILTYSADNEVDLIIMTSHGRSGIGRFAFGSVTDKVVHNSTIPVMMVKVKSN
jgi:nucleotide-binding universal stress UspA family protein